MPVTHPTPSTWELTTRSAVPQVLRLRITDVPGWHASIDGQPVPISRFAGVMLQVEVPAGEHTVTLHYWPSSFTAGIVLAAAAAVGLLSALIVENRRRRHPAQQPRRQGMWQPVRSRGFARRWLALMPPRPPGVCLRPKSRNDRRTDRTARQSADSVRGRPRGRDALGVLWVLGAGIAVLLPALIHGLYLGPYDILSTIGLTAQHSVVVHNPSMRDLTSLFIPFTEQAWTQVHQGHLPLWNPFSGLGMPLAFNWESAPFGLPALVGYLVPLRFAYSVGVLVTVAVAGTGAYVFGRVLKLGVLASAFIGTVFVLGGPVMSLVGWSSTSVSSWTGWLFAAGVVVVRGNGVPAPSLPFPWCWP